jgi:CubicO group peptidase (beta-lactamase class C family)
MSDANRDCRCLPPQHRHAFRAIRNRTARRWRRSEGQGSVRDQATNGCTQYRLASVSKSITAVAILKLVEQGRVNFDRPARDYCTALAPLNGTPTVRHFLLHQSGMRHTSDDEDESIKGAFPRLSPALAGVVKDPLRFEPGGRTLYTSWGYAALGCVIESVSGQSYADFTKERIFAPAQMQDSAFDSPAFTSPTFSPGFVLLNRRPQPSVVVDPRFKMPSSGIISTVNARDSSRTPHQRRLAGESRTVRAGRDANRARGASRCAGAAIRIAKCCGIDLPIPRDDRTSSSLRLALLHIGRMP